MAVLDQKDTQKYEKVAIDVTEKLEEDVPETYGYGVRHVQCLLIFASLVFAFIARAHLSVTIVAMTDVPKLESALKINVDNNNTSFIDINAIKNITALNITKDNENEIIEQILACINGTFDDMDNVTEYNQFNRSELCEDIMKDIDINNVIENEESYSFWDVFRVYPWIKSTQEVVLGAFFLGYLIMTTPMGIVSQKWGGKLPLQISLFVSAVVTISTPWITAWGDYKAVAASRVLIGLAQAGTYPGIHTLIAKWVPLCERGRLGTYVYTGAMVGSVLAYYVGGLIAASPLGWPSIYWLIGILCLTMGILITVFGAASPLQHPTISEREKTFISGKFHNRIEKRQPTPWKSILTSRPVWATFITHCGSASVYLFFFNQVPTYLHHAIGLNIKNSGLLSSLPYFANFLMSILLGNLTDYFVNKKILSVRAVRIISNSIANFGPATCLFSLSFIKSPTLAVICLILCMGTHAGSHTGWMVNYIDLAPNYSGTLMATGNTIMNVFAVLLPVLVSYIVTEMHNINQWRIVLFVVSSFALACNAIFMMFMSADIQPWNDAVYEATDLKDHKDKEIEKTQVK